MIITDKLISPWKVRVEESQYVVFKEQVAKTGKTKGELFEADSKYFTSFESVVKFLARVKLNSQKEVSLKTFLQEYRSVVKQLGELV